MLKRLLHPPDERGQGLVEYALILMLVAIVVILAVIVFGEGVRELYCDITYELDPYFHLGSPDACDFDDEDTSTGNAAPFGTPRDAIAAIPIT
jgi:Flp pilus assembly pilin Flp